MQVRFLLFPAILAAPLVPTFVAAQPSPAPPVSLTIYNQDFAVARTSIDLDLHAGLNDVTTTEVTSQLEPDSVVLRDPAGKSMVHVVEQNYDAGVVNQDWLLKKYEGKTIDFMVGRDINTGKPILIQGRIIRAGGEPGQQGQPLIEVDGHMQFMLPGTPLFPVATDGLLLKPTLRWEIQSDKPARFAAELAYITGGLDWDATYNVVVPEDRDVTASEQADVVGWITIHNQSGTDFPLARIKLMAGDVAKIIQPNQRMQLRAYAALESAAAVPPQVTQKPFDDFHLYDLHRTVALRDGETKQVQFLDAAKVGVQRSYLYDGAALDLQPMYPGNINQQRGYGLDGGANSKVRIVEEIKNSQANHLGIPLPAGRLRLYRRDSDGQMQFVGESMIGHTPADDTVKITTGNAFDLKGSRKQTAFNIDQSRRMLDESFEIKITNQKDQPVRVVVLEHLYRGDNWEITEKSTGYTKQDSHTLEFPLEVPAKGDATLAYTVRYTW